MEKKEYFKPKIKYTKLDSSINLVLMSENAVVSTPTPSDPEGEPPVENDFDLINPFKWFR